MSTGGPAPATTGSAPAPEQHLPEQHGADPDGVEVPWRRLSFRVVWVDVVRLVVSLVPGYLGTAVLGGDGGPVWPLLVASALGVLGAVVDLERWLRTRFRVTEERVELTTGWFVRTARSVPRDRIRSVDISAKARHRLVGIRVVHIGSGEANSSFGLDALDARAADELRRDLMPDAGADPAGPPLDPGRADAGPLDAGPLDAGPLDTGLLDAGPLDTGPHDTGSRVTAAGNTRGEDGAREPVLARFRWQWVACNALSFWAPLVVAGPLLGAYWPLRPFGVDLLEVARGLADWEALGPGWTIAICLAVAYPVGAVALAAVFVAENWGFELVRADTRDGTALLTRRGLVSSQTVYRDEQRIRGLSWGEPLIWRWLTLTDTKVVTTGLHQGMGNEPASSILPRTTRREAREVAAGVLPDARPMEAPLHRHPLGALRRRLLWALAWPGAAAALLAWLGATDALPDGIWPIPLALVPVTAVLAVAAYRSLGHAVVGPYVVLRRGASSRSTAAVQSRAVIGWTLSQSVFQRWGGRMDLTLSTAAGRRHYRVPDAGVGQALALVTSATPRLADVFIEPDRDGADRPPGAREAGSSR